MSYNPQNPALNPDPSKGADGRKLPGNTAPSRPTDSSGTAPSQPARKQSRSSGSTSGHRSSTYGQSGIRGQQAFVINPRKRALEHMTQSGSGIEPKSIPTATHDPNALALQITSELNRRLDGDIDSMIGSFSDIIECSKVHEKDKYRIQQEKYQIECRAANLVRSCESILSLIAEMKQSLLLNDTTMFRPRPLKHPEPGAYLPNTDPKSNTPVPEPSQDDPESLPSESEFLSTLTNLHPVGRTKLDGLGSLFPSNKLT